MAGDVVVEPRRRAREPLETNEVEVKANDSNSPGAPNRPVWRISRGKAAKQIVWRISDGDGGAKDDVSGNEAAALVVLNARGICAQTHAGTKWDISIVQ